MKSPVKNEEKALVKPQPGQSMWNNILKGQVSLKNNSIIIK